MGFLNRVARGVNSSENPIRVNQIRRDMGMNEGGISERNREINTVFPGKNEATSNSQRGNKGVITKRVGEESFRNEIREVSFHIAEKKNVRLRIREKKP